MSATTNPAFARLDRTPAASPVRFVAFRMCTVTAAGIGTTVTAAGEQDAEGLADASELTRWITRHHTIAVSRASTRMKIRAGSGRRAVLGRTGSTMSTPRGSTADTPAAVGPGRGWASVSESVTRGSCENAQACPAPLGYRNGVVLPVPPRGRRLPGRKSSPPNPRFGAQNTAVMRCIAADVDQPVRLRDECDEK